MRNPSSNTVFHQTSIANNSAINPNFDNLRLLNRELNYFLKEVSHHPSVNLIFLADGAPNASYDFLIIVLVLKKSRSNLFDFFLTVAVINILHKIFFINFAQIFTY